MKESERLLAEGIRAARAKDHGRARQLFLQSLQLDKQNADAWLWLSGSVDDHDEKRICLENVLKLDPGNMIAPMQLKEMAERERSLVAPAAIESAPNQPHFEVSYAETFAPEKRYDDVWTTEEPICAFCATVVDPRQDRCGGCRRKLKAKVLANPVTSPYHGRLIVYLIIANLLFVAAYGAITLLNMWAFLFSFDITFLFMATILGVIVLVPIVVTTGIYLRQAWAYWLVVIDVCLRLAFLTFLALLVPWGEVMPLLWEAPLAFARLMFLFLPIGIAYVIYGWLLYTLYKAAPDFERRVTSRIARVDTRAKGAYDLDKIAQVLVKKKQIAGAIVHWRRAVGSSGGNAIYRLRLARAYARLGFYERAVDELRQAIKRLQNEPKYLIQAEWLLAQCEKNLDSQAVT